MQQNDETRFEDFVGLISGLYKEIQRIKTSEGARLGLKGSDVDVYKRQVLIMPMVSALLGTCTVR